MEAEKPKNNNQFSGTRKGYYFHKKIGKYHCAVQVDGERIDLGYFETEEEAKEAYFDAIERYLLCP